jgi:hypothetical protein
MSNVDDRIAEGFRRTISRRALLSKAMRMTFVVGAGTAGALWQADVASAANCGYYGHCGTGGCGYGCVCNPQRAWCGFSGCSNGNCAGGTYRPRCDAWHNANNEGNYCWCSDTCYNGSTLGFYTCCDCWSGGSGGCGSGTSKCLCPQFHGA